MRFRSHQQAARAQTRRLLLLFALVVVGLVLAINGVLAAIYWLTFPFARGLPIWFVQTNTALVLLFVLGGCWVESMRLAKGGPHVAELAGARPVNTGGNDEASRREKRFANIVQEMALASGLRPPPAAWVLPRDDAINALAAGWDADDAVVAVTRGALERLDRAELQGVVAHEFSHILHGDTRLNMRLVGLVWGLQMIWGLGQQMWSADEYGRRHAGALFGLGLMAVGSFGWLAGRLLQAAVSRQREFLADASAVKFTRQVDGLGGALRKIGDQQARRVHALASAHAAALAHLLLAHGLPARRGGWRRWLATHPALGERLARLYGRELPADEQIASADALPIGALDEPPPALGAAVPLAPADGSAQRHGMPAPAPVSVATLEAHRHDATQLPSSFNAAAREKEALARAALWSGPGEWQAAMLALAVEPASPGAAARWRGYELATQDLAVAVAVRTEVEAMSAPARRRMFESLLERVALATPALRRRLWREWSARWRVMDRDAADAWRALVIRHALGGRDAVHGARGTLAGEAAAVQAATRAIAAAMALAPDARQAWIEAALRALTTLGMPVPRGPAAGLAPQVPRRELFRALRARRLSPMQRPLLLRAWLEAGANAGIDASTVGDTLHLACIALALPVPPALRG
jgi:Zn-dependent protease with chaperone function